jgi:hypothetical protein
MKKIKLILALILIFAAFISTAASDAVSIAYAFIPLTPGDGDLSIPFAVQNMHSFERLSPVLSAAQRQGNILAFEPELSFGFVKVQYRSGFDITALAGRPVYDDINAAATAASPTRTKPEQIQTGGVPVYHMELYSNCFDAFGLGANTHVTGSLRNPSGRVMANFVGTANGSGNLTACFAWAGLYTDVVPGYQVRFALYSGGSLIGLYSAVASTIKFTSVNKAMAVVNGRGPNGKLYNAHWYHEKLNLAGTHLDVWKSGTMPGSGI